MNVGGKMNNEVFALKEIDDSVLQEVGRHNFYYYYLAYVDTLKFTTVLESIIF